jgi:signal transduction histidine kinase
MSRDREAGDAPSGGQPTSDWSSLPVLPLALLAAAVVAALLAAQQVLPAWLGALALLLTAAGALLSGAYWSRQRQLNHLREARLHNQLLGQLIDVWCWQTDAEHRLVKLQPPQGAPASAWVAGAFSGENLWQRFDDAAHSLQPRMQANAALGELAVLQPESASGAPARVWRLRGLPRFDARGHFCGYLGVAWPDTRQSEAEAKPADAQALDAESVQALVAEHAAFSYTISHDLRAPIRVVEGFGRILKEDYGSALDRVGHDHLDRMMGAAARMNHMIDALLSLSRLSSQPLARQPVNLSQLAGFVLDELRRSAPERQVNVHIAPGMVVQGDPTLLRMALENLLGNAWKYSAKVAQAELRFQPSQQGGRAAYVVSDNGAGFDMRFADRLFGVFQRLHSSSDFPGTGIGLASVRRIVRRHGGEVWAESEVGQGARFYFTLKP